jgi:quinoprotein relay system zinc metallohydrolase 1
MRLAASLLAVVLTLTASVCAAAESSYHLHPVSVAKDTYVFIGDTHFFNPANGGNIVNTGFIVTDDGVVVIDTGPSLRYGQEMRRAIAEVTARKVVKVVITHSHPDHFLGTQAFVAEAPVVSGAATVAMIRDHGQELAGNLYTLVGDVMRGTEPVVPQVFDTPAETIGGHDLQYFFLSGHTDSDVAVFDQTTGVLFTGDLVFFRRALTVPNANIPRWLDSLKVIGGIPYRHLVPGHGPVPSGRQAPAETRAYLLWIDQTLHAAVAGGLDITEIYRIKIPERFRSLAIVGEEFQRSVGQMVPRIESTALPVVGGAP